MSDRARERAEAVVVREALKELTAARLRAQPNIPAAIAELTNVALAGIRTLEGSSAYMRGFVNVVNGTKQAKAGITEALAFLKGTA